MSTTFQPLALSPGDITEAITERYIDGLPPVERATLRTLPPAERMADEELRTAYRHRRHRERTIETEAWDCGCRLGNLCAPAAPCRLWPGPVAAAFRLGYRGGFTAAKLDGRIDPATVLADVYAQ